MLVNWLLTYVDDYSFLNVFRYITFRTGGAILTSLLIAFVLGPKVINWLKSKQKSGQPIRIDGPQSHIITKAGTPTMGGVLILLALTISTVLWSDITNPYVWIVLIVTLGYGLIGFADDFLKLTKKNTKGLPGRLRLTLEILIGVFATYILTDLMNPALPTTLAIPFLKDIAIQLGWFFIPFAAFVVVGTSNSVNLTDGLDGLAIVPIMIAASCFGLIAYVTGNAVFSNYLHISHVAGAGELAIFCGAMVGAGLGFLWYNAPPAMVFMGDTGSLSTGAALGMISVITKHELVLAIIGGLFVLETVSVIVQVASFKLTGKRVFRMAPLHHHFEQKGWAESTVVIRFWIIAVILALIGLSTLKLR